MGDTIIVGKMAMPVGTSQLIPVERFKRDSRDKSCKFCVNGMRGSLIKVIGSDKYRVVMYCTCVPYIVRTEGDIETIIFKGHTERWTKGVRSEKDILAEAERKRLATQAADRRDQLTEHIKVGTKYTAAPMTMREFQELKKMGVSSADLNESPVQTAAQLNAQKSNPPSKAIEHIRAARAKKAQPSSFVLES